MLLFKKGESWIFVLKAIAFMVKVCQSKLKAHSILFDGFRLTVLKKHSFHG